MADDTAVVCRSCNTTFTGRYNRTKCDDCKKATRKQAFTKFKADNPDYWKTWQKTYAKRKDNHFKQYGLTHAEVDELRLKQDFKCAICGAVEGEWRANSGKLVVDHNHETGAVRGMLCPSCNRGLGQLKDDHDVVYRAFLYLLDAR